MLWLLRCCFLRRFSGGTQADAKDATVIATNGALEKSKLKDYNELTSALSHV